MPSCTQNSKSPKMRDQARMRSSESSWPALAMSQRRQCHEPFSGATRAVLVTSAVGCTGARTVQSGCTTGAQAPGLRHDAKLAMHACPYFAVCVLMREHRLDSTEAGPRDYGKLRPRAMRCMRASCGTNCTRPLRSASSATPRIMLLRLLALCTPVLDCVFRCSVQYG